MNPRITQEQRAAINDHPGEPVYVVDPDHQQTYVLLTSDDYQRVRVLLETPVDDSIWSDSLNDRRCELIDKDIAQTISVDERVELAVLERQAAAYFDKIAPPPMAGVKELHQELLNKREEQQ